MKILQEITKWEDNTPNHIYHVANSGKLVAYQKFGSDELVTFKRPLTFTSTHRKFITLAEVAEALPVDAREVKGSNGKTYVVHDGKCTCSGFKFRGSCKHIS